MSDPVVLVLQEAQPGWFTDFAGNRLWLSEVTRIHTDGLSHPLVARVEIAAPEVEVEPS